MHFDGRAGCARFEANPFRRDICQVCQNKIQAHDSASEKEVSAALEYAVDKVPSKVWAAGGRDSASASLFVGGYKSAVNLDFLKSENVMLIVNAAPGIQNMFPAHKVQLERRKNDPDLSKLEETTVNWVDSPTQKLDVELVLQLVRMIGTTLRDGGSVLVHCAQGKSRSATLAAAFISWREGASIPESLARIKELRKMAEPNAGFVAQLRDMQGALLRQQRE